MPKILISGRGGEQVHEFSGREVVLGCDASCDIVVQGGDVSPEHCKIQPVMGAWKIVDLESDAGTRVNGAYVNQRPLRSGDVLELGDVRLVFQDDVAAAPAPAPVAAAPIAAAPASRPAATTSRRAGGRRAAARRTPRRAESEPEPETRERPQRRARRSSSSSGTTVLLIIGALIVLAGGGYLVLKPKTSPNETVFIRMQSAEQRMDWEAVLSAARAGNVDDPEFGKRIADLKAKAEQQLRNDAAREKLVEATNAWNQVVLWRQDDNWKADEEYVRRIDGFLAEYGQYGGTTVEMARKERVKITGSVGGADATNAADAWAQLEANLAALKATGQFGNAIRAAEEYAQKWSGQDPVRARQAKALVPTLRDEAGKWMGLQISRAQHKVDQGTKLQARKILEKAAEVIGIPELEDKAAEAMREIAQ